MKCSWTRSLTVILFALTGCTHTQLRDNSVNQAETVSDVYQQQVLDNLAMFVYDSGSLPSFAFPNSGTNQVTDTGNIMTGLEWVAAGFDTVGLNIGADRQMEQAWTMEPVRDPHKLTLMRCAYQHAVATCLEGEIVSRDCPDCEGVLDEFYSDARHGAGIGKQCVLNWKNDYGWFGTGTKDQIPTDCGCLLVGQYCDQFVWVPTGNRDKLTQLTLAILDYAVYEPAEAVQKEVTVEVEFDKDDEITKTTRTETYKEDVKDKDGRVIHRRGSKSSESPSLRNLNQQLRLLN